MIDLASFRQHSTTRSALHAGEQTLRGAKRVLRERFEVPHVDGVQRSPGRRRPSFRTSEKAPVGRAVSRGEVETIVTPIQRFFLDEELELYPTLKSNHCLSRRC
jgi:hypothetical protein